MTSKQPSAFAAITFLLITLLIVLNLVLWSVVGVGLAVSIIVGAL